LPRWPQNALNAAYLIALTTRLSRDTFAAGTCITYPRLMPALHNARRTSRGLPRFLEHCAAPCSCRASSDLLLYRLSLSAPVPYAKYPLYALLPILGAFAAPAIAPQLCLLRLPFLPSHLLLVIPTARLLCLPSLSYACLPLSTCSAACLTMHSSITAWDGPRLRYTASLPLSLTACCHLLQV